jgi:hypothetical protein
MGQETISLDVDKYIQNISELIFAFLIGNGAS